MPVLVIKQQSAPNIDPGTYTLELANVREVQVDDFDTPGQKSARIELTCTVRSDPRWEGKQFTDLCTPRLGPKTKLGRILTALAGDMALPDGEIDLEDFVGKRLLASVGVKPNGFNQLIAETAVPVDEADGEAPF